MYCLEYKIYSQNQLSQDQTITSHQQKHKTQQPKQNHKMEVACTIGIDIIELENHEIEVACPQGIQINQIKNHKMEVACPNGIEISQTKNHKMQVACPQGIEIRVTTTAKKETTQNSVQNYVSMCRICLQQMNSDQIFHPCDCRGSNSYFHEDCLMQWIKKVKKQKKSLQNNYHVCEICKGRMFLETTLKYRCVTMQEVKDEIFQKNICCTITTIIFLFCSFTVLGGLLYISSQAQSSGQIAVYSVGLAVTVAIIIVTIIVFIYKYTVKADVITVGIRKKSHSSGQSSKSKVVPIKIVQIKKRQTTRINHNRQVNFNQSMEGILVSHALVVQQ